MWGLKQVRHRRDDTLARVRWNRLEELLAEYYAVQGYCVEHCGTGGTQQRFDGGIDLKLRRDDQYILVQCKGWNAYQVPHNEVHQLIGLMVNEGATGAILVTSGEFTRAAVEAAGRGGHVQLVDGDELRRMLGPISEHGGTALVGGRGSHGGQGYRRPAPTARDMAWHVGDRLLSATEDRIRYGASRRRGGSAGRALAYGLGAKLMAMLFAFAGLLLAVLLAVHLIKGAINALAAPTTHGQAAAPTHVRVPMPSQPRSQRPAPVEYPTAPAPPRRPTEAEIRESQRKADEAMKIIEATTPEV